MHPDFIQHGKVKVPATSQQVELSFPHAYDMLGNLGCTKPEMNITSY